MDAIDRQAAIDALDALCDRECEYSKKQRSVMCGACHLGSAFDVIEQLPSVQPEHATCYLDSPCEYQNINIALTSAQPEIIRCKDCKYYKKRSDGISYCHNHDDDILWQDDDYCSRGEQE